MGVYRGLRGFTKRRTTSKDPLVKLITDEHLHSFEVAKKINNVHEPVPNSVHPLFSKKIFSFIKFYIGKLFLPKGFFIF